MAHFAKLDENNVVIQVIVVNNEVIIQSDGTESEEIGKSFLNELFGPGTWVQTSYNNNFRKQYAYIGYTYDEANDVFIKPRRYESWTLNENFDWEPPIPYPNDGKDYKWDEDSLNWMEYVE
jgi:hypothetical protein